MDEANTAEATQEKLQMQSAHLRVDPQMNKTCWRFSSDE
jgi:hypothetical protein